MFKILLALLLITSKAFAQAEWSVTDPLGTRNASDIDLYVGNNNAALDRLLADYPKSITLQYDSSNQIIATTGGIVCSNSDDSVRKMRRNIVNTTVTWADIDTGAEASSTTYYVYANCDADATTATFKISTSSTSPSGVTYYKRLGSFINNGSSDITQGSIVNDNNLNVLSDIRDFGTSSSSYTAITMGSLKIAYGYISVGASSTQSITNLPFSSTNSYAVTITQTNQSPGGNVGENPRTLINSGSSFTVYNDYSGRTLNYNWIAIGT